MNARSTVGTRAYSSGSPLSITGRVWSRAISTVGGTPAKRVAAADGSCQRRQDVGNLVVEVVVPGQVARLGTGEDVMREFDLGLFKRIELAHSRPCSSISATT